MSSAGPRLVFGLGTGRCGSSMLARLLASQPHCEVFHDYFGYDLPARGGEAYAGAFLARAARSPRRLVGDVFSAWLYYVGYLAERAPLARFVCLRRDRQGTVKSFDRWSGPRNFWVAHDGLAWQSDAWDHCFPDYPAAGKREAIGLYWDDYQARAEAFAAAIPERFRIFDMAALRDEAGQREIVRFCGLTDAGFQPLTATHHERGMGATPRRPPA